MSEEQSTRSLTVKQQQQRKVKTRKRERKTLLNAMTTHKKEMPAAREAQTGVKTRTPQTGSY